MAATLSCPAIIQAIWDNTTESQWLTSGETSKLHHDTHFRYPVGTLILCINRDSRVIFGIATITSLCQERSLLDPEVYPGTKYNKYECGLSFRKFKEPITIDLVATMCGWVKRPTSKQSWYIHMSMRGCYLDGQKVDPEVRRTFRNLVFTWV